MMEFYLTVTLALSHVMLAMNYLLVKLGPAMGMGVGVAQIPFVLVCICVHYFVFDIRSGMEGEP